MNFKKTLFLSLVLIIGLLFVPNIINATTISATETTKTSNGDEVKWSYELSNDVIINLKCTNNDPNLTGKLEIPYELDGYTVTSIGDFAFLNATSLTTIKIPNSIKSIGERVFVNCNSLIDIIVDDNNLNLSSVDGVLFNKNKTTIICYPQGKTSSQYTIPDTVTTIATSAFLERSIRKCEYSKFGYKNR